MNKPKISPEKRARLLRKPWSVADVLRERKIDEIRAEEKFKTAKLRDRLDYNYRVGPFRPVKLTEAEKAEAREIVEEAEIADSKWPRDDNAAGFGSGFEKSFDNQ